MEGILFIRAYPNTTSINQSSISSSLHS